jgi:hypothetical protein
MARFTLVLVLLSVLLAGPALAAVPSTMSYQGVLMDNAGVLLPDGNYSLTFRLYPVAAGGVAVWTETQSPVALSRGGFSVILGSVTPLSGLAFDVPFWLGITVGGGTELAPRVALASSPYGLALRLPFAGTASSADAALSIANTGAGPAVTADRRLDVGTTARSGLVQVYANGTLGLTVGNWIDAFGGYARFYDAVGNWTTRIEPDVDGSGAGWLEVRGGTGDFLVEGNSGTGNPFVSIYGSGSGSYFNTGATGDAAVALPSDAVSAAEILDEPGIAQGHALYSVAVPIGTTMGDIVTVTLTTPADGYIVVEADGQHAYSGSATATYNYAEIEIDEFAGGWIDFNYDFISGYYASTAGTLVGTRYCPISIRRTYYKTAGTYTFRLEAFAQQDEALVNYIYNPTITATFYPTGYGTVTTAVTAEEAVRFTDVQHVVSAGQLTRQGSVEGTLVDLRELELQATRARLQAEQAEHRLIEARAAQQNRAGTAKPSEAR